MLGSEDICKGGFVVITFPLHRTQDFRIDLPVHYDPGCEFLGVSNLQLFLGWRRRNIFRTGDTWAASGVYSFNRSFGNGIAVLADGVLDTAIHFANTVGKYD